MNDYVKAHKHCIRNKTALSGDSRCGCFHCLSIFDPKEITEWITERGPNADSTAMCPYCGIDSVIGESSGYPITEEFLRGMNERWFGEAAMNHPPRY